MRPLQWGFLDIYTEKVTKMALSEKELIEIRRKLHQIPEIGMEEFETQKILLSIIEKFPHDFMKIKTWKTAIIVHLTGSKDRQRSDTGRISTACRLRKNRLAVFIKA